IRIGAACDGTLAQHATLRIPTGGLLPDGADAVVPIEDVRVDGARAFVDRAVPAGDCVHPRGSDMRAGSTIVEPHRFIGAPELGVLASLGITAVPVFRRPRFAVISSGDELVDPSAAPALGQIRDSNRWAIEGALRAFGADVLHLPIVPDEIGAAAGTLREALAVCDGVILTGGSSVGTRDLTPQTIDRLGGPGVIVHGLRVKPGKPTVFGAVEGKPIIGLPGNPASALIILIAVAEPIIAALVGSRRPSPVVSGTLAKPFAKRAGWTWFVPVTIDETGKEAVIQPMEMHSGSVSLLARADGFTRFDEAVTSLPAGSTVRAVRFFRGGM
ncbi:MAG: molybdopterin molybdotransferase MoeA, partial [Candidatus Eremiobacteraeota bacterium]|nr:molybdopterin molybdotransferase MoeA [Candidatus Eremiobacteraeota bacterium]